MLIWVSQQNVRLVSIKHNLWGDNAIFVCFDPIKQDVTTDDCTSVTYLVVLCRNNSQQRNNNTTPT